MKVCIPVTEGDQIDPRWGRADRVALTDFTDGQIHGWEEIAVGWNGLHDSAGEGDHHARIARFLREHEVQAVVAGHMGPPMQNMLVKMGIEVHLGADGPAREATLQALATAST